MTANRKKLVIGATIDPDIVKWVKTCAAMRRTTISAIVQEILAEAMDAGRCYPIEQAVPPMVAEAPAVYAANGSAIVQGNRNTTTTNSSSSPALYPDPMKRTRKGTP
jgi:hypothetical protein